MAIDDVILWYEKNVNYKLTRAFINFLIKMGMIKEDVDLELLNSFMLEAFNGEFIKENDKFVLKRNREQLIDSHKEEKNEQKNNSTKVDKRPKVTKESTSLKNKFKIEKIEGNRMKLIKLK